MYNLNVEVIVSDMLIYSRASRETFSIGGNCFWLESCRFTNSLFEKLMNINMMVI